jgi:UDP-N-acetylglucosamine acyltransferase
MTAASIHPSALVGSRVVLGEEVVVGPYCILANDIEIGAGTVLDAHVVVGEFTRMGRNNRVFPFTTLGLIPQDLKFHGEVTRLEIGDENVIREHCSLHRGTENGGGLTAIGHRNLIMGHSHIAHDCLIGDDNIFSQGATLAGHVLVGRHVIIGGYSGIHQFCRLGDYAFIGGYSVVTQDALPYVKAVGNRARNYGINTMGLLRQGFTEAQVRDLRQAYQALFHGDRPLSEVLNVMHSDAQTPEIVQPLLQFMKEAKRGFIH